MRVEGKGWEMHLGDCLDVMPTLAGVGHVVTDPPYGLDFEGCEWDATIPFAWLALAQSAAPTVVFTTAPTTMWDYPRPEWVCGWHRQAAQSRATSGGFNHWSPILVYGKVKFPVDVFTLHAPGAASPKEVAHPSPKPIALMRWIVTHASAPGSVVLDPFAGSGTTGVACMQLGRRFVGIERDPTYFALCVERLRAEENSTTLRAKQSGQSALFEATQSERATQGEP